MKIIGSRAALMLVRKKFGERAYVARYGKLFSVGVKLVAITSNIIVQRSHGYGKSWAEALVDAGIPVILEVKSVTPDSMPEDTDAKEIGGAE